MGIFDIFKVKAYNAKQAEYDALRGEMQEMTFVAYKMLCDSANGKAAAKKIMLSKGYNEAQANLIVGRAEELFKKHGKQDFFK